MSYRIPSTSLRPAGLILALAFVTTTLPVLAQGTVTTPPGGGNQKSVITQYMGMTSVTLEYNSPDVHAPNGDDRRGKIWGTLVPYGLTNLGFGSGNPGPWRVGANQNTTIEFSHDVEIEGQALAAGKYGLHMIADPEEWTVIFSNNSTSWGSFFYDDTEDALRVKVKAEENPYREWLSFDFEDKQLDTCIAALEWEDLKVPFRISVPNIHELYLANMRKELRTLQGFTWQGWNSAAQYALNNSEDLDEALAWAEQAINIPGIGQENFNTLSTKSQILSKMGKEAESEEVAQKALRDPTANVFQIHGYGRQLITAGKTDKALEVFQYNAERFPDTWPVYWGLARGHSAAGNYEKALEYAEKALPNAPNQPNIDFINTQMEKLKAGEDIN